MADPITDLADVPTPADLADKPGAPIPAPSLDVPGAAVTHVRVRRPDGTMGTDLIVTYEPADGPACVPLRVALEDYPAVLQDCGMQSLTYGLGLLGVANGFV